MPEFILVVPGNIAQGELVRAVDLEDVFGQIEDFHTGTGFDYENIKDRGLSGDRFQTKFATEPKLAANTFENIKLADESITKELIDNEAVNNYHINWEITDGQLVRSHGTGYPFYMGRAILSAQILDGNYSSTYVINTAFWNANALEGSANWGWMKSATFTVLDASVRISCHHSVDTLILLREGTSGTISFDVMIEYLADDG